MLKSLQEKISRRTVLGKIMKFGSGVSVASMPLMRFEKKPEVNKTSARAGEETGRIFNGAYTGKYLDRIAFPLGGIGAGMVCLEGTGALSHVSVRNKPEVFNEPRVFAALSVKGTPKNRAKILEGPVPDWKHFGKPWTGNGAGRTTYGLPRFDKAAFLARFPFATIRLEDSDMPFEVEIIGWSPFIPCDADNSSLPVAGLEYRFKNTSSQKQDAVFSFNADNLMKIPVPSVWNNKFAANDAIRAFPNGFLLWQNGTDEHPHHQGGFAMYTDQQDTVVDHCWFRGGWYDSYTVAWKNIQKANLRNTAPTEGSAPGASLFVPFALNSGEEKTVRLFLCWHVPKSDLQIGEKPDTEPIDCQDSSDPCCIGETYTPWYACRFKTIEDLGQYWQNNYDNLRQKSASFRDSFYASTLPAEVLEAVAANLTILKSPTLLRQTDGKLWCFEGCKDDTGCCHGSCTHVWNYAQAVPHLFPSLERSLRETEFMVNQDGRGHQTFRASLPIRQPAHTFHAAADGQMGGILKVHREWRISGDSGWMKMLWPKVKQSLDYCIQTWDPQHKGVIEEPHHNTYDIEYWGPNGHCTSFYLQALAAAIEMAAVVRADVPGYKTLLAKGKKYMESELFNGEYFIQKITWQGLEATSPVAAAQGQWNVNYSPEALELLQKEGPKYQYGNGCLSDGVLGVWIARMCGLEQPVLDSDKIKKHLAAVHRYNLKSDLSEHVNTQRPSYAFGEEGGLLLCTWPHADAPTLPFVYSNEVWTGIEYQVASHLMLEGLVEEGLEIVRTCRQRYDGRVRNPFNEYECGHWYARALSSYGLIQGLTGVRYDAVEKALYIDSKLGDNFTSFLSTESGFGNVGLQDGKYFVDWKMGELDLQKVFLAGEEIEPG